MENARYFVRQNWIVGLLCWRSALTRVLRAFLLEPQRIPKFKVGDQVERVNGVLLGRTLVGAVKSIIPEREGYERFTEYEIECLDGTISLFYETQLRLAKAVSPRQAGNHLRLNRPDECLDDFRV